MEMDPRHKAAAGAGFWPHLAWHARHVVTHPNWWVVVPWLVLCAGVWVAQGMGTPAWWGLAIMLAGSVWIGMTAPRKDKPKDRAKDAAKDRGSKDGG